MRPGDGVPATVKMVVGSAVVAHPGESAADRELVWPGAA
jgi:hypothetical protein